MKRFTQVINLFNRNKLAEHLNLQVNKMSELASIKKAIKRWQVEGLIPKDNQTGTNNHYYLYFKEIIDLCEQEITDDFITTLISLIEKLGLKHALLERYVDRKQHNTINQQALSSSFNLTKPLSDKVEQRIFDNFNEIAMMSDKNLAYYRDRDTDAFLNLHLDIFKRKHPEMFTALDKRMLTVQLNDKLLKLPCVNLLTEGRQLSIHPTVNLHAHNLTQSDYNNFVIALKKARPDVVDNETFAVDSFDCSTGKLQCKTSSYYQALYHCDFYFYQIVARYQNPHSHTPYEQEFFLTHWANDLTDILNNRFEKLDLSIGISCLVIHKTMNDEYKAFICQKAKDANGFMDMHVIPSSMYQPIGNFSLDFYKELPPLDQVLRELAEEIFNRSEFDSSVHADFLLEQIHETPQNKNILSLMQQGKAEFHITGFYLDLYRLRPEILTTIIIDDESWFQQHFSPQTKLGNWEVVSNKVLAITMNQQSYEYLTEQKKGSLCPPGMACFVKGYQCFQQRQAA